MIKKWSSRSAAHRSSSPTVEPMEARKYMAVSPVIVGTKVKTKNLFGPDNVSLNESVLTVPFTGNVTIADASKIQVRGYAINPLTGAQKKLVVGVVKAEVLAADHSYVQITTDRLMRKGGKIFFLSGALTDANSDTLADQTTAAVKGQNKERFTLACRGFIPTNFNRFEPSIFASSPTPANASTVQSSATVRPKLVTFMNKKVTAGIITQAQADAAIAKYDNATTIGIVPDANMRAALVSLTGTLAEGAIASYIDGQNLSGKPYTTVDFDTPPDPSAVVAQTIVLDTGRLRTVMYPKFKGEPFQVVSAFLAHEALHQDKSLALEEEEIATTVETMVYAQQASVDSSFIASGTALVANENEKLMALIQSGRTIFPYVGLKDAPIRNASSGVFPGQKAISGGNYTSYDNFIRRTYIARGATSGVTAGNALLDKYYTNITGKSPVDVKFNTTLVDDIDSFQAPVGTKLAIQLAGALKLGLA
jgi:hypothetical protein